ncbi:Golgi-associated plant pathogenesis-related protein 1-like isoform X2 [Ruditapes philippinarum]|uniref:Golgi-associated plant pathogenesis-related protein 1-like isoform X2 n=1 Tax=Ruditapes philippinarum TaxID=129788 RepID=UPI00295A8846|nr:Golgi-associated plant pathogenesis-related protein 1-like isoform X2 [Ruditapes philippinarum]
MCINTKDLYEISTLARTTLHRRKEICCNMLKLLLTLCMVTALNGQADKDFIADVVKQHNVYRALHGVPDVTDNAEMNALAHNWAIYLFTNDVYMHNPDEKYGMNLSWMWSSSAYEFSGSQHVDNLYKKEAQFYAENKWCGGEPNMDLRSKFGHYTQIVWKKSTQIGVGKAGECVVIIYSPPGNYKGMYAENVPCPLA